MKDSTSPPPEVQEQLHAMRRRKAATEREADQDTAGGSEPKKPVNPDEPRTSATIEDSTEPAQAATENTPEPTPPNPEPAPANPEPKPEGGRIESLLAKGFASIQKQAFDDARNTLAEAKEVAADKATRRRIDSFFELIEYAEGFFSYREKALDAVRSGIEYKIPSTSGERLIAIVEITPEEVIYREGGKNDRWPRDKIPVAVQTHIVREWFDERPENRLFLGAYFASKLEPDVTKAREEWTTAQAGGVDVSGLMPLLSDPVILEAAE